MMGQQEITGYRYEHAVLNGSHDYLLPAVFCALDILPEDCFSGGRRLFELGCGNGSVAYALARGGWEVTGVDPSAEGIALANAHYPALRLEQGSAYEDLEARYGRFPVALSLEVVEHVYLPRRYAATLFSLVEHGGTAIVSAPFHGYWKNLALAVTGKMDAHFTALWDHGHIKFWSKKTLGKLLRETGFEDIRFRCVGRVPPLAKAMIAIARKP